MNRYLAIIASIIVLFYQIRVEVKGLRNQVDLDLNQNILRILSLLLPLAMLWTSFYSVIFTPTKSKTAVESRVVITLIIMFIMSIILPIMFIFSNIKMKNFVHRICFGNKCWFAFSKRPFLLYVVISLERFLSLSIVNHESSSQNDRFDWLSRWPRNW